ncbi:MAG: periplasmic heavy metal sensor [Kofleriaceae bacterium]
MICLALGLGILGFVAVRRARGYHHCSSHGGGYGPPWQHWHHHGGRHHRGLYMVFNRLDCSPAQERAIISEVDQLKHKLRDTKWGMRDARGDLAAALRGPTLDDAALGAVLGRVDAATGAARAAVLEAMRNVHAVLDDRQREQLAELLDGGDGGWFKRGGSPYRV